MKRKIDLLIGFAALVLVALSAMQYYLVRTAYEYKVSEFRAEIKQKIADVTNDYSDLDSAIFNRKDLLYKELAHNYAADTSHKIAIKNALIQNNYQTELTARLRQKLEKELPGLQIDFAVVLDKFVLYKGNATDTLFSEKPKIANKLYGNLASLDDAFLVRNYVGTTSDQAAEFKLLTEDTLYVSVRDWELIVLRKMTAILFFAMLSIATLITLFVIAIRALIRQKKVADVKTDFINNITHELKTPLTTLSVSTKILQRPDIRENEKVFTEIVQTIDRQNYRLHSLIDQVLTSSLGFEELELTKETVLANEMLQAIVDDFKIANPAVHITTEFSLDKAKLTLDKFHLTTAIINVLENAVKYGCRNITVKSAHENGQFQIAICDDGIGISKSKQPHLFEKFYRVEQGNLHNTKGLGLGLYYVDQIIKAHRGTIKVVSDLGKGATFHISIPS